MAPDTKPQQEQQQGAASQSLIRKLTTEKAVKTHRQQTQEKAASEDEITNIKLSGRGIKTIESLDLPSLRRLDLSKNNLNRLKGLQGCPQVTYLTAAGNELTGEGLDGVRPLRDLKVFNASGNRVKRIPPTVFAQFRQLQALVLNNNEISEVPPTWLKKGLLTLNTLVLSHNKVKSLSDAGLGRLTTLTKLSVSHNSLSELPDLSACSALEELRAAHNLITQVPASLGKNAALRTLDLGHNSIEEWGGLERAGKTLSSLVQLTLAGNPLCGASSPGMEATRESAEEEGEGAGGEGEVPEGEYVTKVRSLFPGLKVRDGKRILMKKSHTYYEQRAAEADSASGGPPTPTAGSDGKKTKPGNDRPDKNDSGGRTAIDAGRRKQLIGGQKSRSSKEPERQSSGGKDKPRSGKVVDVGDAEEEASGKEERKRLKKKAARAAERAKAKEDATDVGAGGAAAGSRKRVGSPRPERGSASDEQQPPGVTEEEVSAAAPKLKKKKRRRETEEEGGGRSEETAPTATAPEDSKQRRRRRSEAAAVETTASSTPVTAKEEEKETGQQGKEKKKKKKERSAKTPTKAEKMGRRHADESVGGAGGEDGRSGEKDPYSSSEELPVLRKREKKGAGGAAAEGVVAKNTATASEGDRESGVVSIVLNRKRKGAKGARGNAWQAGAALQSDGTGEGGGGGERGFSVGAMLEARGQREAVGLGSGVSAWD